MRFLPTAMAGLVLVQPERHADERGHFARTFCADEFARAGLETSFPQWSVSFNARTGTLRGLHFQRPPHGETKLVRCTRGAVHDVVVDLRPGEPTFRRCLAFELSAANGRSLHIPEGVAHGFQTLANETELLYAITPAYRPEAGAGLRFDDPALAIDWPIAVSCMSERDRSWPLLDAA